MNQNSNAEEYDGAPTRDGGFFARMFGRLGGHDEYDDDEEDTAADTPAPAASASPRASGGSVSPLRRSGTTLRMDHSRQTHISVRRSVQTFDDARRAADGLKDGQQQIINLEQTPAEMTERIIDFLNGATYALGGSVEKIGEQVYLFTPQSVIIDIEDKPTGTVRAAIFDRD